MTTIQENDDQQPLTLSERLKIAYERFPKVLRVLARRDFCEYHGITEETFRAKRNAKPDAKKNNKAFLSEVLWMEQYTPEVVRKAKRKPAKTSLING